MRIDRVLNFYKDYFVLAATVFISLILISSNDNEQVANLKMRIVGILSIVNKELAEAQSYFNLKKINAELRRENTRLAIENSAMQEMKLENERLRNQIGFKQNSRFRLKAAKVIGRQDRAFINDIILDVGREDSVRKNMPLVTSSGLVGKVYQVGKNVANAQLLFDQNFRVSAIAQRSRVRGIVRWKTGSDFCVMNEVPKHSDVQINDIVVTSEYSQIFPAGIKIGKVKSVKEDIRGLFMEIVVEPAVNFNQLEEVFVILENGRE